VALRIKDRVKQGTTTTGSGTINLDVSFSSSGFQDFSALGNGTETYYAIEEGSNFEIGLGTYNSNTLTRSTILDSSNGGAKIALNGNANVFVTYPADKAVFTDADNNATVTGLIVGQTGVKFNDGTIQTTAATSTSYTAGTGLALVGTEFSTSGTGTFTQINFDLGVTPSHNEGTIFYDNDNKALAVYNDEADITLQVGQEEYVRVRNNTAGTISNGQAVYINGAHGAAAPTVELAISTGEATSQVIGLATHSIEPNTFGYITTFGVVRDVDTSAFNAGDSVYVSQAVAGGLTGVSPTIPNFKAPVGHVIRSHGSNGTILVQIVAPKLGGGDAKVVNGDINLSGIPFYSVIADTNAGGMSSDSAFVYDSGNDRLHVGSIRFGDATVQTTAFTGTDFSGYATEAYVTGVSGDLQTQITTNANNIASTGATNAAAISTNSTDIATVSGLTVTNANNISSNDTDINTVSGLTVTNATNISNNSTDISTVSGLTVTNSNDIDTVSGLTVTNANNISTNSTDIDTVSGLLYNSWTVTDGSNSEAISAGDQVKFTGEGNTTVSYDTGTNTVSISGTAGGGGGGYDFTVSDGSNSEVVASGDSVTWTGTGATTVSYNTGSNTFTINTPSSEAGYEGWTATDGNATSEIANGNDVKITGAGNVTVSFVSGSPNVFTVSGADQDLSSYATEAYVTGVSGHLQGQIDTNSTDISTNSSNITTVSGLTDTNATDIDTVSGLTVTNATDIDTVSGLTVTNATDIDTVSGLTVTNASDIDTVSGLLYTSWTLTDGSNSEAITGGDQVKFTGGGNTTVSYSTSNNTVTISGNDVSNTYTAGSGLVLDGNEFNVHGGSGNFKYLEIDTDGTDDVLVITSTDDGSSAAPVICTMRDSASPADGDYLGQLKFKGRSDTGTERIYAKITAKTLDVTNGTEDGLIEFAVRSAGSQEIISRIRNDGWRIVNDNNLYIEDNGSLGVRITPTYSLHIKDDAYIGSGLTLPDLAPAVTTNKLYNNGGTLYFDGSAVDSDTTYTAGTGLQLVGTEFNVSGIDSSMIVDGSVANGDLANSSVTITAGTGLSNGGAVSLGSSVTIDADTASTSQVGVVQLQDSATDGTTDKAITPNAVYDISGVLQTNIDAKDNYTKWVLSDNSLTTNVDSNEQVTFIGAGATTISLGGTDNRSVTITSTDNNTEYTAGTGLQLVGTEFNVSGIDSSMIVNGSIANGDLANDSVTVTAGSGLSNGGEVDLGATITLDITPGGVTNDMLGGSIANDKLSNSSVSYGGVSVSLGASDATPAFDLSDATNYPTSSLVGTITNAQLAGSIANAKLVNDSVTVTAGSGLSNGGEVELGASISVDITPGGVTAAMLNTDVTLDEITDHGATTTNNITVGMIDTSGVRTPISSGSGGATATFDLSTASTFTHTLAANSTTTLAEVNATDGQKFMIRLEQNSAGTGLVNFFSNIRWAGGTAPTLTATTGKVDIFGFLTTTSGNYEGFIVGQNI
jgi:hypothetical protein